VPFPRQALTANEEVVVELHPHVWSMGKPAAALAGAVLLGAVVLANVDVQVLQLMVAVLILVALGWFLLYLARWASTWFVLTTERVVYREGFLSKRSIEIPLDSISAVLFEQKILERMMGLGDLTIQSSAAEGDAIFDDIRKPALVQKTIYEEMNARKDRDAQRVARYQQPMMPGPAPTIPDQIAQLASLRDQGVISDAEFQAKKADLLRRM
jgi:uncharacterized membrane protein YdbT with pleckstrin-like domain